MSRRINQAGIDLIRHYEGCRLSAYLCPAGKWTIGVGHTGPEVHQGQTITEEQAMALLHKDLAWAEAAVERLITVPLTDNQFAALVSFTFNVGAAALEKSTLRQHLNAGDYDAVPEQLMRWIRSKGKILNGLVARRQGEGELWRRA